MRKQETCKDKCVRQCVRASLSPPSIIVHQAIVVKSKHNRLTLPWLKARNSNPHVSCLCHSHSRLQTQHSTRLCGGASCCTVWSEIRDELNSGVSPGQCVRMPWVSVSTCVFESDPRCSQSSLNKCGLILISPSFPNGLVHLECLFDLLTQCKLKYLLLEIFFFF